MSQDSQNIISGNSNSFDTGIARTLGLNAAIVFQHIVYWLRVNSKKKDAEMIEGKYWMYETQKEIASYFEYLSEDEVYKAIKKLVESGLLIKDCFNDNRFDRTSWYTTFDQSIYLDKPKLKESLRNRQSTESESVQQRNQNPSTDEIRNRQPTDCSIQEEQQENTKKTSTKPIDDGKFSKEEWEDIQRRFTKEQITEATKITKEKCTCKKGESQRKYFKKVIESFKEEKSMSSNENEETNRQAAFDFKAINDWSALFIKEKYVEAKGFAGKDISLNMSPKDFLFSLQNLYDSLKRKEESIDSQMDMNY